MRRELYRVRRDRESKEEWQTRLERRREYEKHRYAAMNTEQWQNQFNSTKKKMVGHGRDGLSNQVLRLGAILQGTDNFGTSKT